MEICKTVGIIFLILYSFLYLRFLIKTEKPIKQFFVNSLVSGWFWVVLNLTAFLTKLYLPLNLYTLLSVGFGGIPFCLFLSFFRGFFV